MMRTKHSMTSSREGSSNRSAGSRSSVWKRAKSLLLPGHGSSLKHSDGDTTSHQARATTVCAPAVEASVVTQVQIVVPHKRVAFGERIAVVGHSDVLGCWQASNGLLLEWGEGDIWSREVSLPAGVHEFKCVTVRPDGRAEWESGSNRVVQVPADVTGGVQLRCEWANTSYTLIRATPESSAVSGSSSSSNANANASNTVPAAAGAPGDGSDDVAPLEEGFYSCCNSSDASPVSNASASAVVQVGPLPLISTWEQQHQQQTDSLPATGAQAGPELDLHDAPPSSSSTVMRDSSRSTSSTSSTSSDVVYMAVQPALQPQRQQPQEAPALGAFNSSEDLSMYNYEPSNSSNSPSVSISPEPSFTKGNGGSSNNASNSSNPAKPLPPKQQPQRLTSSSLAAAAKASTVPAAAPPAGPESEASEETEQDGLSVSPSTFSGFNSSSRSVLTSPATSSSTMAGGSRVLRGAPSSSTLSYATSVDVSEVVLEDASGMLTEADAAPLSLSAGSSSAGYLQAPAPPTATTAAGGSSEAAAAAAAAAVTAAAAAQGLNIDLDDPSAFEQLMAVDPSVLQQQQQQQGVQMPPDMLQMSAFAAAATAEGASSEEILEAAAQLFALAAAGGEAAGAPGVPAVGPDGLLFKEDTLPPEALVKFNSLSELQQQQSQPQQQQQPASAAAAAAAAASVLQAAVSPAASPDAVSTRLSKDQLPCLGLTVTVPTPADKAAQAAAQLSAASREAAAVKAAAGQPGRLSADGGPVEVPVATEGLRLMAAAHIIPHVDKVHTGGEDAYFISTAGNGALGVSDGVSAWAEDGIDPGEYSRTLVQYCAEAIEERAIAATRAANKGAYTSKFDPRLILRYAQQCTCKPGSATVVLAALQPGGKLHVANLGDCGVKVVREGRVVYETQPQQHDFNLPYQLSHPRLFPDTDTADSADRYTWDVQEGDVIVAASDGLFDNLWDDELLELLQQGLLGVPPRSALDPAYSDSLGKAAGKKMSRSRSFAALSRSLTGGSSSGAASSSGPLPTVASAPGSGSPPPVPGAASSSGGGIPRSRSTSHLSSWGAKQLWHWKGKGAGSSSKSAAAATGPGAYSSVAEEGTAAVDGEQPVVAAASAALAPPPPVLLSPADVRPQAVSKAAELLAAAAAAHAADKEFKSPWSVAAGKAYGLLARLFAKGGKMDDITCVVAVVQDAQKVGAAVAPAAAGVGGRS